MSGQAARALYVVIGLSAMLASGCLDVNEVPLHQLLKPRLEPQKVTRGTSVSRMATLYQTSPGLIRRLNPGMPPGDLIKQNAIILMPRVTCDAMVNPRRRQVKVMCGTILLRTYPCRVGPKGAMVPNGSYFIEKKMKRKSGVEANYLGSRLVHIGGGFYLHGGAPELPEGKKAYAGPAEGAEACIQLKDADAEELYDLLEKSGTVMVDRD